MKACMKVVVWELVQMDELWSGGRVKRNTLRWFKHIRREDVE